MARALAGSTLDVTELYRREIDEWSKTAEGQKTRWAPLVRLAPDFLRLLLRLVMDPGLSAQKRARLGYAAAYFVSRYDPVPEALVGPLGYLDDVAVAAHALETTLSGEDVGLAARHWPGPGDVWKHVREVRAKTESMLTAERWDRIRRFFDGS